MFWSLQLLLGGGNAKRSLMNVKLISSRTTSGNLAKRRVLECIMHQVLQQSHNHTYSCPDATVPQISVPQNKNKTRKTHFFLANCRKHVILEQSIPQPRLEQSSGSTKTNTVMCLHQLPSWILSLETTNRAESRDKDYIPGCTSEDFSRLIAPHHPVSTHPISSGLRYPSVYFHNLGPAHPSHQITSWYSLAISASCSKTCLQRVVLFFVSFSSCGAQVSFLRKLVSKAVHRRSQVLRIFFSRSSKLREERKKLILEYCGPQIISLWMQNVCRDNWTLRVREEEVGTSCAMVEK